MLLLGETRPYSDFNAGQVVKTVEGDRYVILDYFGNYRMLLYFDKKNPEK